MNWAITLSLIATTLLASTLPAADAGTIFYSREQRGAKPAYVQITVQRDGSAVYRESIDDPDEQPVEFRLRAYEVDEIYELSEKLNYFQTALESNLKVANLGTKTFRYVNGAVTHEQQFNFSSDADARILADWFARITQSEQHFLNLERAVQFDKLGVNKVLLQLQTSVEKNRLAAPDQFLPLLDKVAKNESFLNMARTRAAQLAELFRSTGGDR